MRQITSDDIRRELAKRNLSDFTKEFWNIIEGNRQLIWDWYIDVICEHLQAVYTGEIQNLIINIPPRFLKSILCCVNFPAWIWTQDPSFRSIFSSYSASLSARDSIKTRQIIESEKYKRWFREPIYDGHGNLKQQGFNLLDDQNQIRKYSTDQNGHRIATSVDGTATGEGGDLIVVDDPIGAKDAYSNIKREGANFWFDHVYQNRLDNRTTGRRLIIMQRLHQKDLTGHILSQDLGYENLVIPMEKTIQVQTKLNWKDPRKSGEFINPKRYGEKQKESDIRSMGIAGYSGQMNQSPVPIGGGLIKDEWIRFYEELPPKFDKVIITGDLTFKGNQNSDYVCFQCWAKYKHFHYLIDIILGQWSYKETKQKLISFYDKNNSYKIGKIFIEDKANGPAIISDLKNELPGLTAWPEKGSKIPRNIDKVQRVHLSAPCYEDGLVLLPKKENNPLIEKFISQITSFTENGSTTGNDDIVDTATMAHIELKKSGSSFFYPGEVKNNEYI